MDQRQIRGGILVNHNGELKKEIGLFALVSIGVGSVLGSGIFAIPAAMGAVSGPSLILAILLAGIITLFLGLAYAELGSAFPLTGGPYSLPRLAMGDLGGFLMGWGYFLYVFIGTAGIINVFVEYLGVYISGLTSQGALTPLGTTIAIMILWALTFINILGVKWGSLYSIITAVGKLIPLLIFCAIGFFYCHADNFTPFMPFGFTGLTVAITLFFWSYTGFESIVVPTGEVKRPWRNIPLAMILTIVITILVYMLIATVFIGMIDWPDLNIAFKDWRSLGSLTSPLATIAKSKSLFFLGTIATIGAILATGGGGGSWVLVQGRMPFAMAQDKLFWSPVGKINEKFGTPAAGLIFTSILTTIVLIAIPSFPAIALIASITAVVPYAAAVISVPILRKTKSNIERPFKLPFHMTFTLIGFILASYLFYWGAWPWTLIGSILILTGYPAFLFIRRNDLEIKRSLWVPFYLIGIVIVSILGDKNFVFKNFTSFRPLGILSMPYDLIVLALFSILIYFWAYKVNINIKDEEESL